MVYNYKKKKYSSLYELSKIMYLDDSFFAKELSNKKFLSFIKSFDENKYNKIVSLSKLPYPDSILVFKASIILNPNLNFCFGGYSFNSYQELGLAMLTSSPECNPLLLQVVTHYLISEHMRANNFDVNNKEIYEKILDLELIGSSDNRYAYFLIAYYLSNKKNIIYKNVEYPDLYSFVYYLNKNIQDKNFLGEQLSHSSMLKAYAKFGTDGKKVEEYLHLNSELDKSEKNLSYFTNDV